jgi:ketosteroid isomerase-like protein
MLYRNGWKIALAVVLMALCAGCARSDPEQRLRERVAALQAAIESNDIAAMQQHLADDFVGNDGMDRRQARAMATMLAARYGAVRLVFGPLDVRMQPPANASVAFTAMASGGDGVLPSDVQGYSVETAWRESGGEWMLYHAKWTPR